MDSFADKRQDYGHQNDTAALLCATQSADLETVPVMWCSPDALLQRSKSRCFKLVRVLMTRRP